MMATSKKALFPHRYAVKLKRWVRTEREDGHSEGWEDAGTREVRYRVEYGDISWLIQKAAGNKSGRAVSGPVTVVVHPEDRKAR